MRLLELRMLDSDLKQTSLGVRKRKMSYFGMS